MIDNRDGFILADPADASALAERMDSLFDPALREQMGTAGRASALRHTIDDQTDEFVELYREIASLKQSRLG